MNENVNVKFHFIGIDSFIFVRSIYCRIEWKKKFLRCIQFSVNSVKAHNHHHVFGWKLYQICNRNVSIAENFPFLQFNIEVWSFYYWILDGNAASMVGRYTAYIYAQLGYLSIQLALNEFYSISKYRLHIWSNWLNIFQTGRKEISVYCRCLWSSAQFLQWINCRQNVDETSW